jgi:ubiquinone/menaquinone biosynthesis C-methylase UbiE
LDLTPEMQARAEVKARSEGYENLTFVSGDATAMAFPDAEFDKTTCRLALHHFERPGLVLREMRRVTRLGGTINVVDLVADGESSTVYNDLERLRDPSHVNALSDREFKKVFDESGLAIVSAQSREVDVNVQHWLDLTDTAPEKRQTIFEMLQVDLGGGARTGFHPVIRGGKMWFRQTWAIFVLASQTE